MKQKPVIMVSSTVYGIEELLERIYTLLTSFGYEVWMSHKGTTPLLSNRSAFENCIQAVAKCDLFLGMITPFYGSGLDETEGVSITHSELRRALELKKPRWLLSHDHVVFARSFLSNLGYTTAEEGFRSDRGTGFRSFSAMKMPCFLPPLSFHVFRRWRRSFKKILPVPAR
jgi:hypothetical protein